MTIEQQVKDFYSKLQFPGTYNVSDLEMNDYYVNRYLKFYNDSIQNSTYCLDVGCGTGLISNFLAKNNPNVQFDAIDFSDSVDYAKSFAETQDLKNIKYFKTDFFEYPLYKRYDVVICTGVLHHIPDYLNAVSRIKQLSAKKIIIGIYNTYAKKIQKNIKMRYNNEVYRMDQEEVPFETSFTNKQLLDLFDDYNVLKVYPSFNNKFVDMRNLLNYKNGGLTLYEFRSKDEQ